jgi:hypothetical protein
MSGFTSVLKKIGQGLLQAGTVATSVMGLPFVSQLLSGASGALGHVPGTVTTAVSDFNSVAQVLSLMEVAFPATGTGSQKLAAASPVVGQIVLAWAQSNLPGHNKLRSDPAVFQQHVTAFTSSFADIMNDFGD